MNATRPTASPARLLPALVIAALLAGCAQLPPPQTPLQRRDAAALHLENATAQADAWPAERWWEDFHNAQLDALIARALAGSPGLELAAARLREAQASTAGAEAAAGVSLSAGGYVSREKLTGQGMVPPPRAGTVVNQGRATLDFSYDFDWWNGHRASVQAALEREQAARVEIDAARLVLVSAIAQSYYAYQADLRRLDIARRVLARRDALLKFSAARVSHGLDPVIPQRGAEGDLAGARLAIAQIEGGLALQRNQLAALVGTGPGDLPALAPAPTPALRDGVPENLGIDLVGRRPEIEAQRRRIEAASQQIDAARALFYPDITITAFLGYSAIGLNRLFQSASEVAGVAPALRLPLFDGGRRRANLSGSQAGLDTAIAQYNQSIVDAVHQVADQAATLRNLDEQQRSLDEARVSAERLLDLGTRRHARGLADYSTVLQAQGAVDVQAELQAQLDARRISARIALIKALGGGYAAGPQQPAAPAATTLSMSSR